MREVFLVSNENKNKAIDALKKDDMVSRGSIILKSAGSLEIDEEGYFLVLDAPEEAIKKAEELLKGIAEKYKDKESIEEKIKEDYQGQAEYSFPEGTKYSRYKRKAGKEKY